MLPRTSGYPSSKNFASLHLHRYRNCGTETRLSPIFGRLDNFVELHFLYESVCHRIYR